MTCFFDSVINKRTSNEDSFAKMEMSLNHEAGLCCLAVADGMGGLAAGKDYSAAAIKLWYRELVRTLLSDEFAYKSLEDQLEVLKDHTVKAYAKIGRILYKKGLDSGLRGGTTLTTALHFWNWLLIANCGDSPVYGVKDGRVILLSEIQNVAGQMVREGKTSPGSLLYYQNKNRLISYLGSRQEIHPFLQIVDIRDYSAVLVGTDGAFGSLYEEEIQWILEQTREPGAVIRSLFDSARAKGEDDNQTAILYYPPEAFPYSAGRAAAEEEGDISLSDSYNPGEEVPADLTPEEEEELDVDYKFAPVRERRPLERARNLISRIAGRIRR